MAEIIEIPLHPTLFNLDIIICEDRTEIIEIFTQRYGKKQKYWLKNISPEQCTVINSDNTGIYKNETRIVINMLNRNFATLVHEIFHAVDNLFDLIYVKRNKHNTEFAAYLGEYIYTQTFNKLKIINNYEIHRFKRNNSGN